MSTTLFQPASRCPVLDRIGHEGTVTSLPAMYIRAARAALAQPATHPADVRVAIKYLQAALDDAGVPR